MNKLVSRAEELSDDAVRKMTLAKALDYWYRQPKGIPADLGYELLHREAIAPGIGRVIAHIQFLTNRSEN